MKNLPATKKFSNHLLVIKKRLHYNNVRKGCKAAVLKQWPLKTVVEMQDHIPVFVPAQDSGVRQWVYTVHFK